MAITQVSDNFNPELLTAPLITQFAGMSIFDGAGAAAYDTTLNGAIRKGGTVVTVPYFNAMTGAEDVSEGNPLTPETLDGGNETATVIHSGKAVDITYWAQLAAAPGMDPYKEAARQIAELMKRRFQKKLLTAATAALPAGNVIAATGAAFTFDNAIDLQSVFGDEQDDMAMFIMHSKVWSACRKLKDTAGAYLAIEKLGDATPRSMCGLPVVISDLATVIAGSPDTYETLIVKRGALSLWTQSAPRIRVGGDELDDSDVFAVHAYYTAHRYLHPPGSSKPGVAKITTN